MCLVKYLCITVKNAERATANVSLARLPPVCVVKPSLLICYCVFFISFARVSFQVRLSVTKLFTTFFTSGNIALYLS